MTVDVSTQVRAWMHEPSCFLRSSVGRTEQRCTCRLLILNQIALLTDSDLSEPLRIFTEVVSQQAARQLESFHRLIECGFKLEIAKVARPDERWNEQQEIAAVCQRCHGEFALFFTPGISLLELVETAITHTKDRHRA